jgi:hypothetical protein
MQPADDLFAPRVKVSNREDAERLVFNVTATMASLERVLETETEHLQAGRIRDGLAQEQRKSELAGAYLRGLEACKSNAVALARFTPEHIETLKLAHSGFRRAVERNQTVIATARSVSEGLVRGLAEEMNRAANPQVYGASRRLSPLPKRATPILCSRTY